MSHTADISNTTQTVSLFHLNQCLTPEAYFWVNQVHCFRRQRHSKSYSHYYCQYPGQVWQTYTVRQQQQQQPQKQQQRMLHYGHDRANSIAQSMQSIVSVHTQVENYVYRQWPPISHRIVNALSLYLYRKLYTPV